MVRTHHFSKISPCVLLRWIHGWSSRHMSLSCVCQGGVCCLFWPASAKPGSTREQKIKQDPFFRAFFLFPSYLLQSTPFSFFLSSGPLLSLSHSRTWRNISFVYLLPLLEQTDNENNLTNWQLTSTVTFQIQCVLQELLEPKNGGISSTAKQQTVTLFV